MREISIRTVLGAGLSLHMRRDTRLVSYLVKGRKLLLKVRQIIETTRKLTFIKHRPQSNTPLYM